MAITFFPTRVPSSESPLSSHRHHVPGHHTRNWPHPAPVFTSFLCAHTLLVSHFPGTLPLLALPHLQGCCSFLQPLIGLTTSILNPPPMCHSTMRVSVPRAHMTLPLSCLKPCEVQVPWLAQEAPSQPSSLTPTTLVSLITELLITAHPCAAHQLCAFPPTLPSLWNDPSVLQPECPLLQETCPHEALGTISWLYERCRLSGRTSGLL